MEGPAERNRDTLTPDWRSFCVATASWATCASPRLHLALGGTKDLDQRLAAVGLRYYFLGASCATRGDPEVGKPKLEPRFVRPSNSERAADPAYWFLRGVQSALQVGQPPAFQVPNPTLETIQFTGPSSKSPFEPRALVALPGPSRENLYLALPTDGRQLHLLAGPSLGGGQTFELDRSAVAVAAGGTSAFLLFVDGTMARLPLTAIVGQLRGRPEPPIPLRVVSSVVELPTVWPLVAGAGLPLMACPQTTNRDTLILLDPSMGSASMVEVLDSRLHCKPLPLALSHQLRASLSMASIFAVGSRIGLFDEKGNRIFFIDPFDAPVKLRLMSGRADSTRQASFGHLGTDGLLPRATSAALWTLMESDAARMAALARIAPASAPKEVIRALPTSPDARHEFKRRLLEQASFLVLHDQVSGLVTTCSLPIADPRFQRLLADIPPDVLPLCGSFRASPTKIADPFAELQKAVIGLERVIAGPGSSVMFWSPTSSQAVLLHALGEAYERLVANKEHIDSVNAAFGRTDDVSE